MDWEQSRTFARSPESVGHARRFATDILRQWGLQADDVALAVSELTTNAFIHGVSPFTVSLFRGGSDGRKVVVEVGDESQTPPAMTMAAPADSFGRGLMLVEKLSADWGFTPSPQGKVVWALFDCPVSVGFYGTSRVGGRPQRRRGRH